MLREFQKRGKREANEKENAMRTANSDFIGFFFLLVFQTNKMLLLIKRVFFSLCTHAHANSAMIMHSNAAAWPMGAFNSLLSSPSPATPLPVSGEPV